MITSPLIIKIRTCCGFTLVEVLLALVILSIGVSSMMIAMSQALSVVRTARNREIAQNLLRRIDLDFPIEKIDYEERIESGEFDDPEGYYWTREILLSTRKKDGLFLTRTRIEWSEQCDAFEEVQLYTYAPEAESITSEYVNGVTSHTQSKAGFTLLELIVAITILTVAMSIAFQAFSSTLQKEAVKLLKAFIMVTLQAPVRISS